MTISLAQNADWILSQNTAAAKGAATPVWLNPGSLPAPDGRHEAVLFIKPELACLSADTLKSVFAMIDAACTKYGVEILNIGSLGWKYMKEHNIAGEHYGVINKISREGLSALSDTVKAKIGEAFSLADQYIMGAHQFLESYPEWNAVSLGDKWESQNATHTQKLAPGTYAQKFDQNGTPHVLLGGFHPMQLLHFTDEGRSIIVMPVRSSTSWATLRDEMVGATDPTQAPAGALRAQLLADKDSLGIPNVSKGLNGIHLSAGPLEGMVEVVRFTSNLSSGSKIATSATNFGSAWTQSGGSASDLAKLADNEILSVGGKTISAFDATELMDMAPAISTLKEGLKAAA